MRRKHVRDLAHQALDLAGPSPAAACDTLNLGANRRIPWRRGPQYVVVQGVSEEILYRGVVPDLVRFRSKVDLLVARQYGGKRNAGVARAVLQNRWASGKLFGRASERVVLLVGGLVNYGPTQRYLPEQQHIIDNERVRS